MYVLGKHISNIEDADIVRLVENNIQESKNLDFKREFKMDDDRSKQELVTDITSFYNGTGGCIVYGIEEQRGEDDKGTGSAGSFYSQKLGNHDVLQQRIQDTVRSHSDPSIVNVTVRFFSIDSFEVMVIGVPRRSGLPSMVTYNNINKFFKRGDVSKYPVRTTELNEMFMQNNLIREKAERFRRDRVKEQMQFQMEGEKGQFYLHAIPLSFLEDQLLDIAIVEKSELKKIFTPIYTLDTYARFEENCEFNYDGFSVRKVHPTTEKIQSENLLFRNGIIECFTLDFYKKEPRGNNMYIWGIDLITHTIEVIRQSITIWKLYKLEPPFFISIYLNAPGVKLNSTRTLYKEPLPAKEIFQPLVYIDSYELTDSQLYEKLRPSLNVLWQAAKFNACPSEKDFFDEISNR